MTTLLTAVKLRDVAGKFLKGKLPDLIQQRRRGTLKQLEVGVRCRVQIVGDEAIGFAELGRTKPLHDGEHGEDGGGAVDERRVAFRDVLGAEVKRLSVREEGAANERGRSERARSVNSSPAGSLNRGVTGAHATGVGRTPRRLGSTARAGGGRRFGVPTPPRLHRRAHLVDDDAKGHEHPPKAEERCGHARQDVRDAVLRERQPLVQRMAPARAHLLPVGVRLGRHGGDRVKFCWHR